MDETSKEECVTCPICLYKVWINESVSKIVEQHLIDFCILYQLPFGYIELHDKLIIPMYQKVMSNNTYKLQDRLYYQVLNCVKNQEEKAKEIIQEWVQQPMFYSTKFQLQPCHHVYHQRCFLQSLFRSHDKWYQLNKMCPLPRRLPHWSEFYHIFTNTTTINTNTNTNTYSLSSTTCVMCRQTCSIPLSSSSIMMKSDSTVYYGPYQLPIGCLVWVYDQTVQPAHEEAGSLGIISSVDEKNQTFLVKKQGYDHQTHQVCVSWFRVFDVLFLPCFGIPTRQYIMSLNVSESLPELACLPRVSLHNLYQLTRYGLHDKKLSSQLLYQIQHTKYIMDEKQNVETLITSHIQSKNKWSAYLLSTIIKTHFTTYDIIEAYIYPRISLSPTSSIHYQCTTRHEMKPLDYLLLEQIHKSLPTRSIGMVSLTLQIYMFLWQNKKIICNIHEFSMIHKILLQITTCPQNKWISHTWPRIPFLLPHVSSSSPYDAVLLNQPFYFYVHTMSKYQIAYMYGFPYLLVQSSQSQSSSSSSSSLSFHDLIKNQSVLIPFGYQDSTLNQIIIPFFDLPIQGIQMNILSCILHIPYIRDYLFTEWNKQQQQQQQQ